MAISIVGQVGPAIAADGTQIAFRQGRSGESITQDLHPRFYESNSRGAVYSGGMTLTSINAATFTTATLGATCTPIVGIYNPSTSNANMVLLQINLQVVLTALTVTGPGAFVWCSSTGNGAISIGNTPLNRKTLTTAGSQARDVSGLALTGLTTNLVVRAACAVGGGSLYNISTIATAAGFQTTSSFATDDIDGAWIVPPGGVLALLCTTTPVAHSVSSALIWEEVLL